MRIGLTLITALILSGCAALSSVEQASRPLSAYDLTPLMAVQDLGTARGHILIETPDASGAIDTDRIMVKPGRLEVQYLPDVKWVETAPALLQRLIVESLTARGGFALVASRDFGPSPDFVLVADLIAFQAEVAGETANVHIRAVATLIRDRDRRILSTQNFDRRAPASSADAPDIVAAFDEANAALLEDLAGWVEAEAR
jgi:cholesterol transport system auxiliary component